MTEEEWKAFLAAGSRTGKLATTRRDGSPHVMPTWFVLDGDDLVFNTGASSVKGRSLVRTGRASLCVDDERAPFSFVTVSGPVSISTDLEEMLPWSTRIAGRYMGEAQAEEFGRRNAVEASCSYVCEPSRSSRSPGSPTDAVRVLDRPSITQCFAANLHAATKRVSRRRTGARVWQRVCSSIDRVLYP